MGAFVSQKLGEGMKLGTPAGDLERQARRLERKGYRSQAGALMGEAALLRAENRGFSSSEGNIVAMRRKQEAENQILARQADNILGSQPGSMMQEARGTRLDASPTPGLDAPKASRLDASPTPGLDAQNLNQTPVAANDRTRELSLAGEFGSRAKTRAEKAGNLEQRQSLFAEMRAAGGKGVGDEYRQRAAALGVDDKGWSIASERLRDEARQSEYASAPEYASAGGSPSRYGGDVARGNLRTMGAQGAAAEYFRKTGTDQLAAQDKVIDRAFTQPLRTGTGGTPSASSPAAASMTNPLRPGAPAAPTMNVGNPPTVLGGINDLLASEDFGDGVKLRTPAPAPTSLFSAIREDTSNMGGGMRNVEMGARLIAARGVKAAVKGAGEAAKSGARASVQGYRTAKEMEDAAKRKVMGAIPGRTGEYLRNRR